MRALVGTFLVLLLFLSSEVDAQSAQIQYSQTCLGEQTTIVASSSLADTAIQSWNWDLDGDGNFDDANGKTVIRLFEQAVPYPVALQVVPNAGTSVMAMDTVVIDPLPEVNFLADNLCEGQSATYRQSCQISSGSVTQFNWDFDNNGTVDDTGPEVNYICGPAQTYQSRLTCVSDKGCESFALKTTSVHHVPNAAFTAQRLCVGDSVQFINSTSIAGGLVEYSIWNFGDGATSENEGNSTHLFNAEGVFDVLLVSVSDKGCRDSVEQPVTILPLPEAALNFSGDSIIYGTNGVTAFISGDEVAAIRWSTGETAENVLISDAGAYAVTITFTNDCQRNIFFEIDQQTVVGTTIESSIITPNSDGINDFFTLMNVLAGENCAVTIVDQWNKVVYQNNDYQNDWNGSEKIETGAYFYEVKCGSREPLIGNINLLR